MLTICGIATIVEPFFTNFIGLLVYSCLFGFFSGKFLLSFGLKKKKMSLEQPILFLAVTTKKNKKLLKNNQK